MRSFFCSFFFLQLKTALYIHLTYSSISICAFEYNRTFPRIRIFISLFRSSSSSMRILFRSTLRVRALNSSAAALLAQVHSHRRGAFSRVQLIYRRASVYQCGCVCARVFSYLNIRQIFRVAFCLASTIFSFALNTRTAMDNLLPLSIKHTIAHFVL